MLEGLSENSAMCREKGHETEPLDHYCNNCKVPICDKCGETRHTDHTKVSIQQAAEEEKLMLEETLEQVKMQVIDLEVQMKTTTELFTISKEKIAKARKNVSTTIEELIRVLKEHEKTMLTELDVIEKAQQRDHSTQLEHLQASVNELKSSVKNCEEVLRKNVSVETLQAQQAEIERLKGVLKAPIREIYRPCHLRYQTNKEYRKRLTGFAPGKVLVSKTDPLRSLLEWKGSRETEAGKTKYFDIITIDSDGEKCFQEIDEIKVRVQSPMKMDTDLKSYDRSRWRYCYAFIPSCDGEYEVTASVNDQPLPGTPRRLLVVPYRYPFAFKFQPRGKFSQFKEPCAVAIDNKTRNLAIVDRKKKRVRIFESFENNFKELGQSEALKNPSSVAFTQSGSVIVISAGAMICFTTSGKFIAQINNKHVKVPFSLTIACDGRMVVCDLGDKSVKVLSPDGKELLQSFSAPDCDDSPWEAVCHQDKFFVSYPVARCVKTFNNDGNFLYDIGNESACEGQLSEPHGLDVDAFGNLIVCDAENKTLNFFKLEGKFLKGIRNNLLECPWSIAVSPSTGWPFFLIADPVKKSVTVFW